MYGAREGTCKKKNRISCARDTIFFLACPSRAPNTCACIRFHHCWLLIRYVKNIMYKLQPMQVLAGACCLFMYDLFRRVILSVTNWEYRGRDSEDIKTTFAVCGTSRARITQGELQQETSNSKDDASGNDSTTTSAWVELAGFSEDRCYAYGRPCAYVTKFYAYGRPYADTQRLFLSGFGI